MRDKILLLLSLVLLAAGPADARVNSVEEAMAASPSLELQVPEPETFELGNGIRVWVLENDRLPLVTVRAVIRTGAVWEPAEKQGVAELTGAMMRSGGSSGWSADELDEELDFLAANLSSSVGDEQGNVTLGVLESNLEPALEIFADVLRNPTFDADRMEVEKNLIKEQIRRQNDSPIQVGIREYGKMIWGADHPRARTPTEESVDALTREDLRAFHDGFFQPSNVLIGVAGDVSKKKIKKHLEKVLGDWRGPAVEFPEIPKPAERVARVALAEKDVPNTTILMGHLGPQETDELRAAGEVMMHILGSGGFTSYITDRIRNDEGLAYFAAGFLQFGNIDPGVVVGLAVSKTETTCKAADLLLEQFERIQTEDVTDEELVRARDSILNSQAFDYDTPEKVIGRLMSRVYYGLPDDHDRKILDRVTAVTQADVKAAANALIDSQQLSCLAVGNSSGMDCEWSRFAEQLGVELVEIELD